MQAWRSVVLLSVDASNTTLLLTQFPWECNFTVNSSDSAKTDHKYDTSITPLVFSCQSSQVSLTRPCVTCHASLSAHLLLQHVTTLYNILCSTWAHKCHKTETMRKMNGKKCCSLPFVRVFNNYDECIICTENCTRSSLSIMITVLWWWWWWRAA